jgi:CRISPR-associated protein Csb2
LSLSKSNGGDSIGKFQQEDVGTDANYASDFFEGRRFADLEMNLPKQDKNNTIFLSNSGPGQNSATHIPTVARYSLSGQGPRLTDALLFGDCIHAALVELSGGSPVFTGCDESGKPLKGHSHAYILSESNMALGRGQSGEITHVTVYASVGFGDIELSALENLKGIHSLGVQVALLGLGQPQDFGGMDLSRGQCPLLAMSKTWISRTPFIPTRHPKVTRAGVPKMDSSRLQIGSPEHDLRRLLKLDGFPELVVVEQVSGTMLGERDVPWREFQCRRSKGEGRRAAYDRGYGFRIEFEEAVRGPMALGYGAHFGMGGFGAMEVDDGTSR